MRTTVSIDPDLAAKLRNMARERGITFKEALNAALRAGLGERATGTRPYRLKTRKLKLRAGVDLDRALRLAATLEDEETIRRLELRK
ncbi:MAG: ribbon-helix-helix protein, CopG family [Chloroflexi bacterium]|nr:ribbon-helix-helix protein, CopG family [Chloroflexota bacterium]